MSKPIDNLNGGLQDFGKGWMNLTENSKGAIASFWDFDWGANIHRNERRAFPDETILATVYERADHMKGLTPGWDKDMHFVHSTDFFKSAHTRLVACGNQFEVIGHKVCTHGRCLACKQLGELHTTQGDVATLLSSC